MNKAFEGKEARIIFESGFDQQGRQRVRKVFGRVVFMNESYLINKDRFGKLHFIAMRSILKIDEWDSHDENTEETQGKTAEEEARERTTTVLPTVEERS